MKSTFKNWSEYKFNIRVYNKDNHLVYCKIINSGDFSFMKEIENMIGYNCLHALEFKTVRDVLKEKGYNFISEVIRN